MIRVKNLVMKGNKLSFFKATLILVFLGITILSLLPPRSGVELGKHDKINHFIAYTVLSLNYGLAVRNIKKYLFGLPLLIAYGLLMEFCQGFVPGREQSLLDGLANGAGVSMGFLFYWVYQKQ